MNDPYNLQRFVDAQAPVFEQACKELRAGRKQSHWMWFVFPQLKGLGHSATAQYFGIASRDEAQAYLQHPLLGQRLFDCTQLVLQIEHQTIGDVFSCPDDLKFHSSMTLFARAGVDNHAFVEALNKYFAGEPDAATLARLAQQLV